MSTLNWPITHFEPGVTTTFTTIEDSTTFEMIYPCQATKTGVCAKVLKSSGSSPRRGGFLGFLIFLMVLVSVVLADTSVQPVNNVCHRSDF